MIIISVISDMVQVTALLRVKTAGLSTTGENVVREKDNEFARYPPATTFARTLIFSFLHFINQPTRIITAGIFMTEENAIREKYVEIVQNPPLYTSHNYPD